MNKRIDVCGMGGHFETVALVSKDGLDLLTGAGPVSVEELGGSPHAFSHVGSMWAAQWLATAPDQ